MVLQYSLPTPGELPVLPSLTPRFNNQEILIALAAGPPRIAACHSRRGADRRHWLRQLTEFPVQALSCSHLLIRQGNCISKEREEFDEIILIPGGFFEFSA